MTKRPISKAFIILSLFAILLLGFSSTGADQPDFPNIYIDEGCAGTHVGSQANPYDALSEINWTTGGDNSIFDYLAGAPSASPTIHFNKGDTWREQLTVGCSGTATYPIVITSYGSGADPIISGMREVTGWDTAENWSADEATITYYSDSGSVGVDGEVDHISADDTWDNIHDGVGNAVGALNDNMRAKLYADNTENTWYSILRAILTFDTSGITDGAIITAVKLRLCGSAKADGLSCTPDINVYLAEPASHTVLEAGDYNSLGATAYCDTAITYASWDDAGWNEFSFNATGIAAINKTGYTDLGIREATHDAGDSEPGWISFGQSYLTFRSINYDSGSVKPELQITAGTANVWHFSLANDPRRVFLDGTEYIEAENLAGIDSTNRWWYDSGNTNLYVYATENPATAYSSIEASNHGATYTSTIFSAQDYITIEDINIQGGYKSINLDGASYNIIDGCTIGLYSGHTGVHVEGGSDYNEVKNCTLESGYSNSAYTYMPITTDGILIFDNSDHNKVYNCTVSNWLHACISIENTDNAKTANHNEVYENILSSPNTNYCRGISTDAGTSDDTCAYNKIYRNYIKNTTQRNQIHGNHNEFYYNIVDTVSASSVVAYAGSCDGLAMFAAEGQKCHDNKIYNNIFYNLGAYGIKIMGEAEWGDKQSNLFKNNIIMNWGAGKYGIHIDDDATILDNTYQNNSLYKSGITDVVYYGHDGADDYPHTIAEFNAENGTASDVIGSNIGVDPLMTDPANDNFKLNPHSPCINAGTDVSLTEDYEGNAVPQGSAPDIGAYEYGELGETIIINPILKIIINPIIIKPIIK